MTVSPSRQSHGPTTFTASDLVQTTDRLGRHLFWDAGYGFGMTTVNRSGISVLVMTAMLTIVVCLKHTVAWRRGVGVVEISERPVRLDTLRDDADTFPPTERKS